MTAAAITPEQCTKFFFQDPTGHVCHVKAYQLIRDFHFQNVQFLHVVSNTVMHWFKIIFFQEPGLYVGYFVA
jgi:hypothetical protein